MEAVCELQSESTLVAQSRKLESKMLLLHERRSLRVYEMVAHWLDLHLVDR